MLFGASCSYKNVCNSHPGYGGRFFFVREYLLTSHRHYLCPSNGVKNKLGRLKITTTKGDIDNDGDYDELYIFGARSFSIWNSEGILDAKSAIFSGLILHIKIEVPHH